MSVILKALKSAEKDKKKKESLDSSNLQGKEGFFRAKKLSNAEDLFKPSFNKKRLIILVSIFIFVLAFALTMFFLRGKEEVKPEIALKPDPQKLIAIEKAKQAAKVVVSPVPQKSTTDIIVNAKRYFEAGDYAKSVKLYKDAVRQNPGDAYLHNSLGLVYVRKGLYASAASEFQSALELDDECAECFNNFGYLKSILGETVEAKKYLDKATSLSNSYPDPYFNLAVLYEKEGDIGNAVRYYRRFLDLYPNQDSDIYYKVSVKVRSLTGK